MPELPDGTNVLGVGTDLIEVDRVRSSIQSHADRFIEKVFTSTERTYCEGMADPVPHFAARFAAKEAISKAFRTGIGGEFGWHDAEIENGSAGEPHVRLSEKGVALLEERGGSKILISLSHLSTMAMAVAVIVS